MTPLSLLLLSLFILPPPSASASTLAVFYSPSPTICAIASDSPSHPIICHVTNPQLTRNITSNLSFHSISGSSVGLCAVLSGGHALICWNSSFVAKRLFYSRDVVLTEVTYGDEICALTDTQTLQCWREKKPKPNYFTNSSKFTSISSGLGFSCGVLANSSKIKCWGGSLSLASLIQSQFVNETMLNIVVGGNFACGLSLTGFLTCKGGNHSVNLNFGNNSSFEYSGLALGEDHVCAIRASNGSVVCSGREGGRGFSSSVTEGVSFESVVAGLDFTCGLTTANFSVICWGPGWNYSNNVPLPKILPGPCVKSTNCGCGIYPQSQLLCGGDSVICKQCVFSPPNPSFPPVVSPISPSYKSSTNKGLTKGLLAFAIVGSVGAFSGICTIIYCLYVGVCCGKKKVHNSVQPTVAKSNSNGRGSNNSGPPSKTLTFRRQGSRMLRRERSGTSKHAEVAKEFSFLELASATDNFALENKIGAGSFGTVYRGKLWDNRDVAIKRGNMGAQKKKFQEKDMAFDSELAFLSRLHHKHLVRLVGFCEENEERLLVYDYMKNGALHDHLHDKNNVDRHSSVLNSWKMRIKIALDAARGIDYLHNYAVPPIIHRDIKSSNILLDENWTARVSDFGLSLMEPESDRDFTSIRAAGTIGYIDPESYSLNVLTAKNDVYGFGVVLLEILTGKRAVFKLDEVPKTVVEVAVPAIMGGDVAVILDGRIGSPESGETEAVELVAYTAVHCVNLEGKDRPNMTDIVANLERALELCGDSHGSISSGGISIVSE